MKFLKKLFKSLLITFSALFILGVITVAGVYFYLSPNLPSIETLKEVKLQVPLRVYTADKKLISEFGEMKRSPLKFDEIPQPMIDAILSAEDNRYFEHPGVDYQGILRAVINLALTGKKSQGGSTITMQVARNFFLSSEKTYLRKVNEIFLAFKIEHELTKEEILELYLNKIYLGHRSYGIGAAAQVYYGKTIDQLTISEMAMIAGLPKAPSRFNPITNSKRAVTRRNYVLGRMYALNHIDSDTYIKAKNAPDSARLHGLSIEVNAPHIAEMVRAHMVKQYGDEQTYTGGFNVITTIDSRLQVAANNALRRALLDYDARHGYRGTAGHVDFSSLTGIESWQQLFRGIPNVGYLTTAAVLAVEEDAVTVLPDSDDNRIVHIPWGGLSWARKYLDENRRGPRLNRAADVLKEGDLIYIQPDEKHGWRLSQPPQAEGALVSISARDGHIIALTGGYDFHRSNFNRVTQATRQPGSNFKPFIYSAALERGFTAASIINDAPVVFDDPGLESAWRPENYSGKFFGPTRLRKALIKSRNLVSIRLMRSIGIPYALEYVSRFGFDADTLPRDLSLALGSGAVTPLQLSTGYATLANGGYRVTPFFIKQIVDADDRVLFEANPATVCRKDCIIPADEIDALIMGGGDEESGFKRPLNIAKRVVSEENIYLMTSMLRDVIKRGTGRRALQLKRNDLAGKTGTTNDQQDAWFSGYNADVATIAWVGFDQVRSLGNRETGGRAALPMWIYYMREALKGTPEKLLQRPAGLVTVKIDPDNGLLADSNQSNAIFETFRSEYVPTRHSKPKIERPAPAADSPETPVVDAPPEQLF